MVKRPRKSNIVKQIQKPKAWAEDDNYKISLKKGKVIIEDKKPKDTFNRVIVTMSVIIGCIIIFAVGLYALKYQVTDVNFYNGYCYDKDDGNYNFTVEEMKYIGDEYKINQIQMVAHCKDGFVLLQLENVIS